MFSLCSGNKDCDDHHTSVNWRFLLIQTIFKNTNISQTASKLSKRQHKLALVSPNICNVQQVIFKRGKNKSSQRNINK